MDWLLLAVLGIIWAAVLLPGRKKEASPAASVEEFGKNMDRLAESEQEGRWVVMPQKGVPIGTTSTSSRSAGCLFRPTRSQTRHRRLRTA